MQQERAAAFWRLLRENAKPEVVRDLTLILQQYKAMKLTKDQVYKQSCERFRGKVSPKVWREFVAIVDFEQERGSSSDHCTTTRKRRRAAVEADDDDEPPPMTTPPRVRRRSAARDTDPLSDEEEEPPAAAAPPPPPRRQPTRASKSKSVTYVDFETMEIEDGHYDAEMRLQWARWLLECSLSRSGNPALYAQAETRDEETVEPSDREMYTAVFQCHMFRARAVSIFSKQTAEQVVSQWRQEPSKLFDMLQEKCKEEMNKRNAAGSRWQKSLKVPEAPQPNPNHLSKVFLKRTRKSTSGGRMPVIEGRQTPLGIQYIHGSSCCGVSKNRIRRDTSAMEAARARSRDKMDKLL